MALKRLAHDHHNMHRRHLVIGDALAVILALRRSRSSSQLAPIFRAASDKVLASFCQVSHRWVPREWNGADLLSRKPFRTSLAAAGHCGACEPILITNAVGVDTFRLE